VDVKPFDLYDISDTSVMEETVHPVKLVFERVPDEYLFSPEARSFIISEMNKILDESLGDRFELINTSYAGMLFHDLARRRLHDGLLSLPLLIRVSGPSDLSESALPYVIQVIQENMQDLEKVLKSLDGQVFEVCLVDDVKFK